MNVSLSEQLRLPLEEMGSASASVSLSEHLVGSEQLMEYSPCNEALGLSKLHTKPT